MMKSTPKEDEETVNRIVDHQNELVTRSGRVNNLRSQLLGLGHD